MPDAVLEQGAERRDPDRDTGEAEGVADSRRHPGSRRIHHAESAGRERGIREPDPDASDDEAREECRPARVGLQPVHQREPRGDERETGADHQAERHTRGQSSRQERHEEDEHGERQEPKAGRERRVAEDVLEVDREVREDREHPGRDAERRDRDPHESPLTEERHVEHRPLLTQLDHDEDDQHQHAADQRQEDQRARPTTVVAAEDAEHDQEQRRGEGHETGDVRPSRALVAGLRDPGERNREGEDADRDVDEEDPAPSEPVGQETTDQRAGGDRSPHRGTPDGKRAEEVVPAVLVADDRQRRCKECGAADPLQPAGDVEGRDVPGEAAEERGEGEEHHARHEDQAAPVPVGERARGEDQRGKAERIRVDDPLQPRQAGIEALLHVRESDDHDRDVEQQHERRQADGEKRPLPRVAVVGRLHPRTVQKAARRTDCCSALDPRGHGRRRRARAGAGGV